MSIAHVVDQVPAAGAVEAEHQLAVLVLAERVLELVAVASCSTAGTIASTGGSSKPPMRSSASRTWASFSSAGARRGAPARARPDAAPAARCGRARGSSSSTRSASAHERLDFVDARADAVARHGAAHEHDVARSARATPAPP